MALNDNAVFTAARGYIYTAAVATAAPTTAEIDGFDPDLGLASWNNIGHTSREDLPEFGFDGGENEPRGTWQNEVLREVQTEPVADYVTFRLHQFDEEGLSLYYGVDNAAGAGETGRFRVANSGTTSTERALLIVVVDGDIKIGLWAPKVGIRRDDAIGLSVDEFAVLPLRATFLKASGQPLLEWISADTGINPGS